MIAPRNVAHQGSVEVVEAAPRLIIIANVRQRKEMDARCLRSLDCACERLLIEGCQM